MTVSFVRKESRYVMSEEIEQYRSEKLGYLHVVYDFFFHFFHLKCILEVFISKYSSCKA